MDFDKDDADELAKRFGRLAENGPPTAVLHPLMALATENPEQLLAHYSKQDEGLANWRILALFGGNIIYVAGSALAPTGWTWDGERSNFPVEDATVSAWSRPLSTVKAVQIRESASQDTWGDGPAIDQASFAWSLTFDDVTLEWPLDTRNGAVDQFFASILRPTG